MYDASSRICSKCQSFMELRGYRYELLKCPTCGYTKGTMQLTLKDYDPKNEMDSAQIAEATILLERVNALLLLFGKHAACTSGFRSKTKHEAIYAAINAKKKLAGLPEVRVPWKSRHLSGAAIDVSDSSGELAKWCIANEPELVRLSLWLEHPDYTKGWVHFQTHAPASGMRFFKP